MDRKDPGRREEKKGFHLGGKTRKIQGGGGVQRWSCFKIARRGEIPENLPRNN